MRIANYLRPECVALHQRADSLEGAVQQLVALLDGTEDLTDTAAFAADVRARLALGGVCVGNGLAIPHAKSASVKQLRLAALTLDPPLACDTPDGKPLQMLVMIAAPAEANDLHVQVLAELATLFLDTDFCTHLRESATPEAFCRAVAEREAQDDPAAPPPQTTDEPGYRLLGVTACPTGIAHTYMAAEALEKAGAAMNCPLKAETNGSGGAKNVLTRREIADCDGIIIAADKNVEMSRFDGKPVLQTTVSAGINKPQELIQKVLDGKAPIYHADGDAAPAGDDDEKESFGHKVYKHLMNGVSHMLPFVVGGGVLIALGFLIDTLAGNANAGGNFGQTNPVAAVIFWIGKAAFSFMIPILAGYIAQSIADRPGLLPGIVGGYLATIGATLQSPTGNDKAVSGFLGALLAGFVAGLLVNGLKKAFSWMPKSMDGIKPVFLYPLFGTVLIGLFMLLINPFVGYINLALSAGLKGLGETSRILLSVVLAAMMAIDMGGPFNKAAYVFGTASVATGDTWIMAAVMIGGMVPPIAIALSTTFNKKKWTKEELKSGPVNYAMGLCFITEGAIPYAASDPLRVIPSCMVGSAVAGLVCALFGCACPAPHGGVFTFAVVDHPLGYVVALVAGSVVGALMLALLKKNKTEKERA